MEATDEKPFCFRYSFDLVNETVVSDVFCFATLEEHDEAIRNYLEQLRVSESNDTVIVKINEDLYKIIKLDELVQIDVIQQPILPVEKISLTVTLTKGSDD